MNYWLDRSREALVMLPYLIEQAASDTIGEIGDDDYD